MLRFFLLSRKSIEVLSILTPDTFLVDASNLAIDRLSIKHILGHIDG